MTVEDRQEPRIDARRNREAVLTAAIGLLAEQPQASMQDIADVSQVGRSTVYRHFPAREDLVRALFVRVGDEARAIITEVVAQGGSADGVLRRLALEMTAIGDRYRFLAAHRDPESEAAMSGDAPDPLAAWIEAAHARGELSPSSPPAWQHRMLIGMAAAAGEEVATGRIEAAEAGRLLGESYVRTFLP